MQENLTGQINIENIIEENDNKTDTVEYVTSDFSKFKFMANNRDINKKYVAKLKKSISERGYIGNGILVNENFEVLDGQHRLTACMELGVAVKYIIKHGYDIKEISALNMNGHNWNINTFVNSYVKSGSDDYKFFADTCEKYKVSTASMKVIITYIKRENAPESEKKDISTGKIALEINNGLLQLNEYERELIVDFLDALEIFNFFKKYHTDTFIRAFIELYTRKDYSQLQMIKRLEKFNEFLTEKKNKFQYLDVLCNDIYSKGRGAKIYYNLNRKKFEGKF